VPSKSKISVKKPERHQGITVESISHYYGKFQALKNINFQAKPGEVCAILGPNGSGKTTLMRLVTGFFMPTAGNVWLSDVSMTQKPLEAKKMVGYVAERFPLYTYLTVREFLTWCLQLRDFKGKNRFEVDRVMDVVGLKDRAKSRIAKLSKGMRQRVSLAQALLGDTPYLILDEPTSGLDPNQIRNMRELLQSLKGERTILLSTHILAEAAEVADRIIILSEGSVIAKGKPGDLAEAYLDGEMIYRVGFRGNKEDIQKRLSSLDLLNQVECTDFQGDKIRLELRVKPHITEEDLLGIFEGIELKPFEFYKKELKLEDVFVKALTRETAK
jgi:ABC-2 type transport system ATP-binding protein